MTATAILAELGDARRFRSSDDAVRHCGLDVTVWQSDRKRAAGHLSHHSPSLLRWALFEAAQCAARRSSPDHTYRKGQEHALIHASEAQRCREGTPTEEAVPLME